MQFVILNMMSHFWFLGFNHHWIGAKHVMQHWLRLLCLRCSCCAGSTVALAVLLLGRHPVATYALCCLFQHCSAYLQRKAATSLACHTLARRLRRRKSGRRGGGAFLVQALDRNFPYKIPANSALQSGLVTDAARVWRDADRPHQMGAEMPIQW